MNQGSGSTIVLTVDQPATFSSIPRGIAIVMLAQQAVALGAQAAAPSRPSTRTLVKSTIQKHSRCASSPTGVASQAKSHATSVQASVKAQASVEARACRPAAAASAC